jgi:hypothetical protein
MPRRGRMTEQDIESEISYAYLHAVASAARGSCNNATRVEDNNAIDANLTMLGPFDSDPERLEVDIKVQLKATFADLPEINGKISYPFRGIAQYDKLRRGGKNPCKILILLQLPRDREEWIKVDEERLLIQKCARWVSLRGAPCSDNETSQTIYIPKMQIFDPNSLRSISEYLASGEYPVYEGRE